MFLKIKPYVVGGLRASALLSYNSAGYVIAVKKG